MCLASNPTEGTWKFNESKSKFGDGMGKSTMVVWEKAGENDKCTVDGMDAEGKKTQTVWNWKTGRQRLSDHRRCTRLICARSR